MPQTPQISVLMPVYNGMPFLPQAIDSVLTQTEAAFELWVRDDGSTDGSTEYLAQLRDPRIRVILGGGRLGLFGNLNFLLKAVRSRYVRILCQDDWLDPECLFGEIQFLDQHPTAALSFCKHRRVGISGQVLSEVPLGDLPEVLPPSLSAQHFFYHGCLPGNLSAVCVRASVLRGFGGFDPSFKVSADYDLWSRIAAHYPMGVIHEHLVNLRAHRGQLSRARHSVVPFVVENARVRQRLLPFLPKERESDIARFETRRHGVLDFHQALHCFLVGRWADAFAILVAIKPGNWVRVVWAWLVTLNNRRRPQAPWVLPTLP